jgi:hypothetical protein
MKADATTNRRKNMGVISSRWKRHNSNVARASPHLFDLNCCRPRLRRYRHFLSALHQIAAAAIGSQHQQNKPIDEICCMCLSPFSPSFPLPSYLKSAQRAKTRTNIQDDNKHKVNLIPTPFITKAIYQTDTKQFHTKKRK